MLLRLKILNFGEIVTEKNKCYPENRRVDCVHQLYSKKQKSVYFQCFNESAVDEPGNPVNFW